MGRPTPEQPRIAPGRAFGTLPLAAREGYERAIPMTAHRRRWFSYSLGGMFVLVTVVGVWLKLYASVGAKNGAGLIWLTIYCFLVAAIIEDVKRRRRARPNVTDKAGQ